MIERSPTPTTRAAVMNSASRSARYWPRTSRAICGHVSSAMTMITDCRLGPDDRHEDRHEQQRRQAQQRVGDAPDAPGRDAAVEPAEHAQRRCRS